MVDLKTGIIIVTIYVVIGVVVIKGLVYLSVDATVGCFAG